MPINAIRLNGFLFIFSVSGLVDAFAFVSVSRELRLSIFGKQLSHTHSTMTIKPVKSDKNEGDVSPQHRDCLNKISSPKNTVSSRNAVAQPYRSDRISKMVIQLNCSFWFTVYTAWNRSTE